MYNAFITFWIIVCISAGLLEVGESHTQAFCLILWSALFYASYVLIFMPSAIKCLNYMHMLRSCFISVKLLIIWIIKLLDFFIILIF